MNLIPLSFVATVIPNYFHIRNQSDYTLAIVKETNPKQTALGMIRIFVNLLTHAPRPSIYCPVQNQDTQDVQVDIKNCVFITTFRFLY